MVSWVGGWALGNWGLADWLMSCVGASKRTEVLILVVSGLGYSWGLLWEWDESVASSC